MTRETLAFDLAIRVVGKPRQTRRDRWQQRPAVVQYREFADTLRSMVGIPTPDQVWRVDWIADIEPPPSWSKRKRRSALGRPHQQKPDRDNIDKSILDALFPDDSGVAAGFTLKRWSDSDRLRLWIHQAAEPPAGDDLAELLRSAVVTDPPH